MLLPLLFWCTCIVVSVVASVKYNGGFLPDVIEPTLCYYHWGTRSSSMKSSCPCSQFSRLNVLTGWVLRRFRCIHIYLKLTSSTGKPVTSLNPIQHDTDIPNYQTPRCLCSLTVPTAIGNSGRLGQKYSRTCHRIWAYTSVREGLRCNSRGRL